MTSAAHLILMVVAQLNAQPQSTEIPARFVGTWSPEPGTCEREGRLVVRPTSLARPQRAQFRAAFLAGAEARRVKVESVEPEGALEVLWLASAPPQGATPRLTVWRGTAPACTYTQAAEDMGAGGLENEGAVVYEEESVSPLKRGEPPYDDLTTRCPIVKALAEGDRAAVARAIVYPVGRGWPLAPLNGASSLLAAWDQVFDASAVRQLVATCRGAKDFWEDGPQWRGSVTFESGRMHVRLAETETQRVLVRKLREGDLAGLAPEARALDDVRVACHTPDWQVRVHRGFPAPGAGMEFRLFLWPTGVPRATRPAVSAQLAQGERGAWGVDGPAAAFRVYADVSGLGTVFAARYGPGSARAWRCTTDYVDER